MRMNEFIEHVTREDQPKAVEAPSDTLDIKVDKVSEVHDLGHNITDTSDHKTSTSDLNDLVRRHVNFRGTADLGKIRVSSNCGCNYACTHSCSSSCVSSRSAAFAGQDQKVTIGH